MSDIVNRERANPSFFIIFIHKHNELSPAYYFLMLQNGLSAYLDWKMWWEPIVSP